MGRDGIPQAALFESGHDPKPLTERQQFALDTVRNASPTGLAADEVGAAWCNHRGKHPADERCQWCPVGGRDVLRRLRELGHVKSRRDGSWYALHDLVEPDAPAADVDPFPVGF